MGLGMLGMPKHMHQPSPACEDEEEGYKKWNFLRGQNDEDDESNQHSTNQESGWKMSLSMLQQMATIQSNFLRILKQSRIFQFFSISIRISNTGITNQPSLPLARR